MDDKVLISEMPDLSISKCNLTKWKLIWLQANKRVPAQTDSYKGVKLFWKLKLWSVSLSL